MIPIVSSQLDFRPRFGQVRDHRFDSESGRQNEQLRDIEESPIPRFAVVGHFLSTGERG
jgi:hypothetical protein